jgi:hypothetical protein
LRGRDAEFRLARVSKRLFIGLELPPASREMLAALDPEIKGVRLLPPEQPPLGDSFHPAHYAKPLSFSFLAVVARHSKIEDEAVGGGGRLNALPSPPPPKRLPRRLNRYAKAPTIQTSQEPTTFPI